MASFAIRSFVVFVLLTHALSSKVCSEDLWDQHPSWDGAWATTPELEKFLGIKRKMGDQKHPDKIEFSFLLNKKTAKKFMGEDALDSTEQRFGKMKHEIFAAGSWKVDSDFKGYSDRDSILFVTRKDGVTFLWIGTPDKSFMGAEVHYVRGVSEKDDLLILDFGFSNSFKRRIPQFSGKAIGYKRIGKDNKSK